MRDPSLTRRMTLQALLALGGSAVSRGVFAEPNIATRAPGATEELGGSLSDPEPLFAAPTRLGF